MGGACSNSARDMLTMEQERQATSGSSKPPDENLLSDAFDEEGFLSGMSQTIITAKEVERGQLDEMLKARVGAPDEAEAYIRTLRSCLDLLINGVGGVIIMVMHEDVLNQSLELESLDGGALYRVISSVVETLSEDVDSFKKLLDALTAHSATDRWTHTDVVSLVSSLGKAADTQAAQIGKLEGQPKDGAILLSHRGTIKGASMHIKYKSRKLVMQKADGTSAGTRHASSLGIAEWLCTVPLACPGIVFTRSDGGGAHAFIPQPSQSPQVLHFKTIHALSQEEMFALFKDRMARGGKLMLKKEPVLVRSASRGEHVVTVVGGRVTSSVTVDNDTSYVAQASTPDQEHYVLSQEKFLKNYETPGVDLSEVTMMGISSFMRDHFKLLRAKGFKLYKSRPNSLRCLYTVTAQDIQDMGINSFESAWGATQPVQEGDYLASAWPQQNGGEIYLMPKEVVGTYKQVSENGLPMGGEDDSRKSECLQSPMTPKAMLDVLGEIIEKEGQLMVKKDTAIMRPAVLDETIVTCISGRVISCMKVTNDTSKVVKGDQNELYVLSQDKFLQAYEPEGIPIDATSSADKLLSTQGFKMYKPKAAPVMVYKIRAEDISKVADGFGTENGTVQAFQEGDYLAVSDWGRGPEVYKLTVDELASYTAVNKPAKGFFHRPFAGMCKHRRS